MLFNKLWSLNIARNIIRFKDNNQFANSYCNQFKLNRFITNTVEISDKLYSIIIVSNGNNLNHNFCSDVNGDRIRKNLFELAT